MNKYVAHQNYYEYYEYHGNTTIERIRRQGRTTILRDWIIFDSVEEAKEYFYNECEI